MVLKPIIGIMINGEPVCLLTTHSGFYMYVDLGNQGSVEIVLPMNHAHDAVSWLLIKTKMAPCYR